MWGNLAKAAISLLPKEVKEKIAKHGAAIVISILALPALILFVLFNPFSSSSESDEIYLRQLNGMACGQHAFYLDEVRLFEYSLLSYVPSISLEDENQISQRLRDIYFHKTEYGCVMRDDSTIVDGLKKLGIPELAREKILEDIKQFRFERQKVAPPLERMSVRQNYSVLGLDGTELETSSRANVKAVMDGVVESVGTSYEEIELEVECPPLTPEEIKAGMVQPDVCSEFVELGRTITLKHEMTTGINDDTTYKKEPVTTSYSHLGNVKVSVGQEVKQGDVIASTDENLMFFRMIKNRITIMNPEDYIYLYARMSSEVKAELEGIEMTLPLRTPYTVASRFELYDPFGTGATMHYGMDLAGRENDPIYSATAGKVTKVFYDSIGGNQLWIQTENYTFVYAHMSKTASVRVGQTVALGERVGSMGDTGKVTGVHLHFEIRDRNGRALDPSEIMEF